MSEFFEGMYYKHQNKGKTLAVIKGNTEDNAFIQIITNDKTYHYDFHDLEQSDFYFEKDKMVLNLPNVKCEIGYNELTPSKSDIMGPFKFFPLECSHSV